MKLKYTFLLTGIVIIGITITSLPSCGASTPNTLWIAHRGAPGGDGSPQATHFENIVESYEKAGLENFYGLETDVYRTSDGGWVIVHDDNPFYKTTPESSGKYDRNNGKYVNNTSFSECLTTNVMPSKNYPAFIDDSTAPCHHLNSFSDYLNVCKLYNKEAIIEIKEPSHLATTYPKTSDTGYLLHNSINYLPDLWTQVTNADMQDQCVIISFQECYIRWFAQNHQELNVNHRLQMLVDNYIDTTDPDNNTPYQELVNGAYHNNEGIKYDVSLADDETAYIRQGHISIVKEMIDYAHAYGRKFGIWTVDIQSHANDYVKWGADFITTDYYKLVNNINQIPPAINW